VKAKKKGSRRERQARDILKAAGYAVTKAGGSFGAFDLIALGPQGVRCVQVKSNRLPSPIERETMVSMRSQLPTNSTIEAWIFYDGNGKPRIELL
jgi:Holliday junction resolvase